MRYRFADQTAVVTGAASGIGKALAGGLAARGSSLVLLDRDGAGLERVARTLRGDHGQRVEIVVVDLADAAATDAAGARLAAEHPETTLLINNAGVALYGTFAQVSLEEFGWVMDVNFRSVVTLTHHLLPVLRSHPGSHLACVSSVFGLVAPAGQSAYASSKFAVRGFTEALRHELAGQVGVTCVHPGGVATQIAATARIPASVDRARAEAGRAEFGRLLTMSPTTAAELILRGIEHRRPRVLIGSSARVLDLLARATPASHARVLNAVFSRPGR